MIAIENRNAIFIDGLQATTSYQSVGLNLNIWLLVSTAFSNLFPSGGSFTVLYIQNMHIYGLTAQRKVRNLNLPANGTVLGISRVWKM